MEAKTAKVYMLGNMLELETGKIYDLPILRANALVGVGYAIMAEEAAAPAKEDE